MGQPAGCMWALQGGLYGGCKGTCMGPVCGLYGELYGGTEEPVNKGHSALGVRKRMKGLDCWWHFAVHVLEMWSEGRTSSLLQGGDPACKLPRTSNGTKKS